MTKDEARGRANHFVACGCIDDKHTPLCEELTQTFLKTVRLQERIERAMIFVNGIERLNRHSHSHFMLALRAFVDEVNKTPINV